MILHVLIAMAAGWLQRHQPQVITYLIAENRLLKAQLGGRPLRLTDTDRRRLAALAHPLVGIVDDEGTSRRVVPDVTVVRKASDTPTAAATVTVSERRATISASVEVTITAEPLRHQVVEIRDASRGHKLITPIEIVSPSNKRAGVDRRAYLRKQREVLESDASLIEIDLLRSGERLLPNAELEPIS